ncbi:MAG: twin transmembrane helix small protein [Gammaproteobacteria bacterium]|nr:twin transmembrane helix small protein [Gammaproteobacteria bacterium]
MFKTLIIINLVLIIISLFSGIIFLAKDKEPSNRIVTSFTIRVGLSICLICLLLVGYFTGNLQPHGI